MNLFKSPTIKRIFGAFTIYTAANFIGRIIPFIMLPIMTRFLNPVDYGIAATFISVAAVIDVLICLGSDSAVMRGYYDRDKSDFDFPKYVFNAIIIIFTMFVFLSIIFVIFQKNISQTTSIPKIWVLIFPLASVFTAICTIAFKLFVYKRKPFAFSVSQASDAFMEMLLSLFFVAILGWAWRGRILGITFNKALFFFVGLYILIRSKSIRAIFDYEYVKAILRYGVPVLFHSLGIMLVLATDRIFINKFVGVYETGLYSVGYSISAVVSLFVGAFAMAWMPFLYERLGNATHRFKVKVVKATYLCFIIILISTALLIISAPLILKIVVGKDFQGASKFIFWIASAYIFQSTYNLMVGYILYQKKTHFLAIMAAVVVILNIVCNYFLIKINGAIGAAQATFITLLARFGLSWYFSNKAYPMPWFSFAKIKKPV